MTDTELHKLHGIFTDCWKLLKGHADVRQDEEYWNSLIDEGSASWERYGRHPLGLTIISAIGEYLNEEYQKQYPNGRRAAS